VAQSATGNVRAHIACARPNGVRLSSLLTGRDLLWSCSAERVAAPQAQMMSRPFVGAGPRPALSSAPPASFALRPVFDVIPNRFAGEACLPDRQGYPAAQSSHGEFPPSWYQPKFLSHLHRLRRSPCALFLTSSRTVPQVRDIPWRSSPRGISAPTIPTVISYPASRAQKKVLPTVSTQIPSPTAPLASSAWRQAYRTRGWNASSPCSRSQKSSPRFRGCSSRWRSTPESPIRAE
jgi:hypothetical protein